MKLRTYLLVNLTAIFCFTQYTYAQQGFIQQDNIKVSGITTDAQTYPLTTTQKQTTRTYLDGLGRPIQTLAVQASPAGYDIIQPYAYDNLGRQTKSYLPYAGQSGDVKGSFRTNALSSAQPNFYNQTGQNLIAKDGSPFTQQVYEDSPLQRLLKAGTVGDGFQAVGGTGTQHYKIVSYRHNVSTTDGNIRLWNNDGTYTTGSVYADYLLTVADGVDEDGAETLTFTDLEGKTILKRQKLSATNLDTYYIYNAAGMLIYTVPPKAIELLNANSSYTLNTMPLNTLVFKFVYDGRGRIVSKTVPSKGATNIVYDPLNRPVLSQDANMAATNTWLYNKYDVKGRLISSGTYQDNTTSPTSHIGQANMQAYVNTLSASYATTWYETRTATLTNNGYYTSVIFPTSSTGALTPLAYNYYDDYDMNFDVSHLDDYSYVNQSLTNAPSGVLELGATTAKIKGAPTITCKATVGPAYTTAEWLTAVTFYDKRGNPIQSQSNNHVYYTSMTTLTDTKTTVPDFTGVPQVSKVTKKTGSSTYVTVFTALTYDHMYRLKTVGQGYGTTASTPTASPVAAYTYNELGQPIQKGLGYLTASTWLQKLDMRYSIRGQLLTINNSTLTNDGSVTNGETTDVFGMEMLYDKVDAGLSNTPSYNGKLTGVKWMSKDVANANSRERGYIYSYDQLGRYTSAVYGERTTAGTGAFSANANAFNEAVTSYDVGGNIISLTRNTGTVGGSTATAIDNLTYSYDANNPNRLSSVNDATGNLLGFRAGSNIYQYDPNGNLTKDLNKTISQIDYNVLNRTQKITFSTPAGRYIDYTYDATGQLIRKRQYENSLLFKATDYIDGFVYEGTTSPVLVYFPMPEGRVRFSGTSTFTQEFVVTDQQGNARISFENNSGTILIRQENSYYGFGMAMLSSPVATPSVQNNKLYNGGSEWQNDYSNLPDYYQTYNRNYDPALGRWVGVDPVAESQEGLNPYQYAANNPIAFNDPLGDLLPLPGSKNGPQEAPIDPKWYQPSQGSKAVDVSMSIPDYLRTDFSDAWSSIIGMGGMSANQNETRSNELMKTLTEILLSSHVEILAHKGIRYDKTHFKISGTSVVVTTEQKFVSMEKLLDMFIDYTLKTTDAKDFGDMGGVSLNANMVEEAGIGASLSAVLITNGADKGAYLTASISGRLGGDNGVSLTTFNGNYIGTKPYPALNDFLGHGWDGSINAVEGAGFWWSTRTSNPFNASDHNYTWYGFTYTYNIFGGGVSVGGGWTYLLYGTKKPEE